MSDATDAGWLLLTNDDGIQAIGMKLLVESLNQRGHKVVVFAPSDNQSATGMRINLMTPLEWRFRNDLKELWNVNDKDLHLIELDGTPCDTMIVALDRGLQHILPDVVPRLVYQGKSAQYVSGFVSERYYGCSKRGRIVWYAGNRIITHLV